MSENMNVGMSVEEAAALVRKGNNAPTQVSAADHIGGKTKTTRTILVVGTGDGGCNIASEIRKSVTTTFAITYNTTKKGYKTLVTDAMIIPEAEDGSGKERSYSQKVFKSKPYQNLLQTVQSYADRYELDYVFVTSTTDGGTGGGVSPMVAKLLSDNLEVPVVIIGVYPALSEDAVAQHNAIMWQTDVEKTGLPYMIFDNDGPNKLEMHRIVNNAVVNTARILTGEPFGETNLSSIDNRDMFMLLSHVGGRIVVSSSSVKPSVNQTLDDYFLSMLNPMVSRQPEPANVRGVGIFLKGPKSFLDTVNTSLPGVGQKYGEAALKYVHLEESDDFYAAIILAGNSEPSGRILLMRQRYDDIFNGLKRVEGSAAAEAACGMGDPLGISKIKARPNEMDLSALDL